MKSRRLFFYELFRKGEYIAASFYCREWLKNPDKPIGIYFKNLFDDEFLHWRFLGSLTGATKSNSPLWDKKDFITHQQNILTAEQEKVGSKRNYLTPISKSLSASDMVGIGSRSLVFKTILGKNFTKDLVDEDKAAFILLADETNHLFYKIVNLVDQSVDYSFLWRHAHRSVYPIRKRVLFKWLIKYFLALAFLPIDIMRFWKAI